MSPDEAQQRLNTCPGFKSATVERQLAQSATGESYLITKGGNRYVARLRSTDADIYTGSQENEYLHSATAASLGIAPEPVYDDPESGISIRCYAEGRVWTQQDIRNPQNLQQLGQLLQRLHSSGSYSGDACAWAKSAISRYVERLNDQGDDSLIRKVRVRAEHCFTLIENFPGGPALCHNDLMCANILETSSGELMLLDWEYSAVGDPVFDLAVVLRHHNIDEVGQMALLTGWGVAEIPSLDAWRAVYESILLLWLLTLRGSGCIDSVQQADLRCLVSKY